MTSIGHNNNRGKLVYGRSFLALFFNTKFEPPFWVVNDAEVFLELEKTHNSI
jgi:hypothetical protein